MKWIILIAVWVMLGCAGVTPAPQIDRTAPAETHIMMLKGNGWNYTVLLPADVPDFQKHGATRTHRCVYHPYLHVLESAMDNYEVYQLLCTERGHNVKSLLAHYPNGTHRFWIYPNASLNHSGEPEEVNENEWALFLELMNPQPEVEKLSIAYLSQIPTPGHNMVIEFPNPGWGKVILSLPKDMPNLMEGEKDEYQCQYQKGLYVLQSKFPGEGVFEIIIERNAPVVKALLGHYPDGSHRFWIYPFPVKGFSGLPSEVHENEWILHLKIDTARPSRGLDV